MAYQISRSAFRYMDDATFRSGPSVAPAYGTSRSKDPRIPRSIYSPARQSEYGRASHAYGMAYEQGSPYESDMYTHGRDPRHLGGDIIQRTNQEAALQNSSQYHISQHAVVHPIMCNDGGFPSGFSMPRPLVDLMSMSEHSIEQILADYGLPAGNTRYSNDMYGRESSRARKLTSLATLLEFLGARQLAEAVRQRGMMQMDSRRNDRMMLQY
ncbi:uncharacterized protein RCC_02129 [Ramularia collo-cygni]|uniref:Uncharacterized protein n=1 Tax=Ramularia collo-cygni TaxID=112498 RepID=A0A2D3UVU8_9PEZI|nr:uncharacterized protein RCC_02129 [Ramularia collo-cygni]CZT16287.1 uncharacterized protein RCC_02129 [Ramularia collo-cygni]